MRRSEDSFQGSRILFPRSYAEKTEAGTSYPGQASINLDPADSSLWTGCKSGPLHSNRYAAGNSMGAPAQLSGGSAPIVPAENRSTPDACVRRKGLIGRRFSRQTEIPRTRRSNTSRL